MSVLKHGLLLVWLNTLNLSFFVCNASQGNTSSVPSSVWARDPRSGMQQTAQGLKMKNLVRGGCTPGLSGMGWVLSHTTRRWGQASLCTVWQAQAPGTALQTEDHMLLALHSATGFLQLPVSGMWDQRIAETLKCWVLWFSPSVWKKLPRS